MIVNHYLFLGAVAILFIVTVRFKYGRARNDIVQKCGVREDRVVDARELLLIAELGE
jgi:hypothetical protein